MYRIIGQHFAQSENIKMGFYGGSRDIEWELRLRIQ